MKIEKKIEWVVPQGIHQAQIVDARLVAKKISGKDETVLRLICEIMSLVHPTKQYTAKREYKKSDSNEIIADLEHLLGRDIHKVINLAGEIIPGALTILEGTDVDIEVVHHRGKNHDEPFCMVTQVKRRGVLIGQIEDEG